MSKIETNQVDPATGTTLTLGTSGDTISIPSGVTIANSGTATGFSGAFESALVHIQDQKSAGTNGGSASDNDTVTRDLNTVLTNEVTGASLGLSLIHI